MSSRKNLSIRYEENLVDISKATIIKALKKLGYVYQALK